MTMISKSPALAKMFISLIFLSSYTFAFADGPFDPTFAGSGLFPYAYWFRDSLAEASGIARDSHGRLLVATSVTSTDKDGLAATRHIAVDGEALIPELTDGVPDKAFGTNGIASDFFGPDNFSYATAIAVDHHDRVLVGGTVGGTVHCPDGTTKYVVTDGLVRLRNDKDFDGQADLTFGTFGAAIYGDCSNATWGIASMAVDSNDSVVTTGTVYKDSRYEASVVRWTSDGQLDGGFGDAGAASAAFMGNDTFGTAIAIDSLGRILVVARASTDDGVVGLLTRFTPDGKRDTTFGSGGYAQLGTLEPRDIVIIGTNSFDSPNVCCVKIDSRNRLLVAGTAFTPSMGSSETLEQSAFVARFKDDGKPDETFGLHGFVYPSANQLTGADALAIDNKDRPVVGGYVRSPYFPSEVTVLTHFNLDGSLNKAVGFGGVYTAAFGFSGSYITSLLIDGAGRPTLTASGDDSDSTQVPVLIRYDELFGDGFD